MPWAGVVVVWSAGAQSTTGDTGEGTTGEGSETNSMGCGERGGAADESCMDGMEPPTATAGQNVENNWLAKQGYVWGKIGRGGRKKERERRNRNCRKVRARWSERHVIAGTVVAGVW